MTEKKLFETSINVKAFFVMAVHAESKEEATKLFNRYLKEKGVNKYDLCVNAYESPVDKNNVYSPIMVDPFSVDIDDYFNAKEEH